MPVGSARGLGGTIIELDARVRPILQEAQVSNPAFDRVTDCFAAFTPRRPVQLDLLFLDAAGFVQIHESTRKRVDMAALRQGLDESSELAILAAMPSGERAVCLAELAPKGGLIFLTAQYEDPALALAPLHDQAGALPGFIWEQGTDNLLVSIRLADGTPAALRIAKRAPTTRRTALVETFLALRRALEPELQAFGKSMQMPTP